MIELPDELPPPPDDEKERVWPKFRRALIGKPRSIAESSLFHRLTLIPVLAWVGLGADGLSSSSYGPEEAFRALQGHGYMAIGLAAMTAITVLIIASGYSRIIEEFPSGGGGYVVASRLLGEKVGVLSGCALLVDYILTIAVSLVAAGDAMFSVLPVEWQFARLPITLMLILGLTILNIRGVRESVLILTPIFVIFVITHAAMIGYGVFSHISNAVEVAQTSAQSLGNDFGLLGFTGMFLIFAKAYSMGGGTYTGLEAVSNGMPIMREPRVHTARRTMVYMAVSLSITAAGLILCYLLWNIAPVNGKTMNAVLAERIASGFPLGELFVVVTLFSAGALLVVGAQAGFIDGPRVLSNMAVDSWVPRSFSMLSERLTTSNGIILMGLASFAIVVYTRGNIHSLVVMYSINVFLTFSLSMFAMMRLWFGRKGQVHRKRRMTLFSIAFILCATVLVITVFEKFMEGGWLTVVFTSILVIFCFAIRAHYNGVMLRLTRLNEDFQGLPVDGVLPPVPKFDPEKATAIVLVTGYGGLGIHTLLNIFRSFPEQYHNLIFLSVGIIDSGEMKGSENIERLKQRTEESLQKYVRLAAYLGLPAIYRMSIGTDVIDEAVSLCLNVSKEFPKSAFFAGQLVFQHETWYHRFLHNQTAFSIQRRLIWEGKTMVVLPVRVR